MQSETEIAYATAHSLQDAYRAGRLNPVDAAQALLDRIERAEPHLNAFVHVDPPGTLAMAEAAAKRWRDGAPLGPLDGVPITIKDLVGTAGWPLRRGSAGLPADNIPAEDAPCVARLREAGAVFLGKTATPDAGCKIVTRSRVHGETANPYDLSKTPGGSSGGASAALATGLGPLAVGTDGAGSIRIPAAYCNVTGIKPSFGRVPSFPPSLFMPHAVIGPMGRCARDVAQMLDIMAGPEPRDPFAMPAPSRAAETVTNGVAGMRIAVTHDFGMQHPDLPDDVLAAVETAAEALTQAGAEVFRQDPDWPLDPAVPFLTLWDATYAGYVAALPEEQRDGVDPTIQTIAARGNKVDILDYHAALGGRLALTAAAHALFREVDLMIGPVNAVHPYALGSDWPAGKTDEWSWSPFTYVWNMTSNAAASVPAGFTETGLPIGVQIVGANGGEAAVLACAHSINETLQFSQNRPTGFN